MPLTREQDRERQRRRRQDPAVRARENEKARARMARLRQDPAFLEREKAYRAAHPQAPRFHTMPVMPPKPRKPRAVKPPPRKVDPELRAMWAKAHPNSAVRRRYPTMKALQASAC